MDAYVPNPVAAHPVARPVEMEGETEAAYIARLKQSRVDDAMLTEVIATYARAHFEGDDEREAFVTDMTEPPHGPAMRKAILDILFSVTAATEMPTEHAFHAVVDALGVGDGDDQQVRDVQQDLLVAMRDEAEVTIGTVSEQQFTRRLDWVRHRLGTD